MSPLAVLMLALSSTSLGPVAVAGAAPSTTFPANRAGSAGDQGAMRLLEKAARAPATTPYNGVQFISAWTDAGASGIVVEVNSRPGVGTSVHTDGNAHTPAADTFIPATNNEPSLLSGPSALALLSENYELSKQGGRTVAGRDTELVEARRPGARTPAGRFWIDAQSGLVLRREVYDEKGRTTRASAFVEIEIGRASTGVASAARMPSAWPREVGARAFTGMRSKGWHCPERLTKTLSLVDARRGGGPHQPILHLSFSDGLSSVSLFEQRGRLDAKGLVGFRSVTRRGGTIYVRDGVPTKVVWTSKGMVFTVVADASSRTVDEVVSALPRPDRHGGTWARLSRGMDRVASWFNPFG